MGDHNQLLGTEKWHKKQSERVRFDKVYSMPTAVV